MSTLNLSDYIEIHADLFDHHNRLCARLTEGQLGLQSLCPDWDVRGVIAHVLAEVAGSIGYIVGKKIGLPDGMSIVFHVNGDVERDLAVLVDGRARVVDTVDSPDVEGTADVQTFMMLAAGRIDPQAQIDAGKITWTGDGQWGDNAARNLAYTM